jgi:hypothetical protein
MNTISEDGGEGRNRKRAWVGAAIGIAIVTPMTLLFMSLVNREVIHSVGISGLVALVVAWICLVQGVMILIGLSLPALGAKFLNFEDEVELRLRRGFFVLACFGLMCIGCSLGLAALSSAWWPSGNQLALALSLAFGGGWLVLHLVIFRQADEMMREIMLMVSTYTFRALFVVGGGWAMIEHFGFMDGPAPLDWLTMMWGFMFPASYIALKHRGALRVT